MLAMVMDYYLSQFQVAFPRATIERAPWPALVTIKWLSCLLHNEVLKTTVRNSPSSLQKRPITAKVEMGMAMITMGAATTTKEETVTEKAITEAITEATMEEMIITAVTTTTTTVAMELGQPQVAEILAAIKQTQVQALRVRLRR